MRSSFPSLTAPHLLQRDSKRNISTWNLRISLGTARKAATVERVDSVLCRSFMRFCNGTLHANYLQQGVGCLGAIAFLVAHSKEGARIKGDRGPTR